MNEDRLLALAQRLADKQQEIEKLNRGFARVTATRGWAFLEAASLTYRLLLFQPEAYHRARNILRRARSRILGALRRRGRAAAGFIPPDNVALYQLWRAWREPDDAQLAAQRRICTRWRHQPLVSIVSPVFAPPAGALADSIESVRAQTYPHWELVLVLAGPQPDEVLAGAERAAAADARVRLVRLDANRGIAANTNAGIEQARGELVAFLDHDDLLAPGMLFEVVRTLQTDPALDLVTFDEDKVAADGRTRLDPIFKPSATSPEHMLSYNDRMHSVVRRASLDAVGGLAAGVDGAQDWDLGLRLLEHGARALHIPRVLYHWRMVPGSAAGDAMAKPWAFDAQKVAIRSHLERLGLREVSVEHPQVGVVRARWAHSGARVSIIIPTRDKASLLEVCLRSIREKTAYPDYEVILIDTGSREPATRALYDRLSGDAAIRILRDDAPFNFSRVNNAGARAATGSILLFLNNDIEVTEPGWLDELVSWAERDEIGCVGPKLVYPGGSMQHAGIVMGMGGHGSHVYQGGPADHTWGVFGSQDFYRNYLALGGACLAIRRSLFETLGGFDEAYELCYSDIDLCLKAAEHGRRNVYTPFARLVHHEGGTRGLHFPPGDVLRATVRMYPLVIQGDPFYNRNLSFEQRIPTVAAEDEPTTRADLLDHIAGLFGIRDQVRKALQDELMGRTEDWRGYERLIQAGLPAVPEERIEPGRLRLLVVTHDLSRSGAPVVVLHLARALTRLGHAVTVLSPKDGRMREDLEEAGASVIVSPLALEAPYALRGLFARFDAVVPNTVLSWQAARAAVSLGQPVVWLIHESRYGLELVRRKTGAIEALVLADEVVFPSRETLGLYGEFDTGNLSAEVYGIGEPCVPETLPSFDPARFHLVTLGSLEPRKGQDVLVTAFRKLPREVRERAELHLLGRFLDPEFVKVLKDVAAPFNVRFHGEVAPGEALACVAAADALVCSSRDETGPLAVMEAMALSKPIVSTMVGAVPELIEDGKSGLLVPPGDAAALQEALHRLLTDPDRGRHLGAASRASFEKRLQNDRYGRAIAERIERAIKRA